MAPLPGLRLLLGYHNYYAIHRSPYMSAHVLIEKTLVQHKMANNSHMALCCQNQVSKGTNKHCRLHSSTSSSIYSASITVLGLLKKNLRRRKNYGMFTFRNPGYNFCILDRIVAQYPCF